MGNKPCPPLGEDSISSRGDGWPARTRGGGGRSELVWARSLCKPLRLSLSAKRERHNTRDKRPFLRLCPNPASSQSTQCASVPASVLHLQVYCTRAPRTLRKQAPFEARGTACLQGSSTRGLWGPGLTLEAPSGLPAAPHWGFLTLLESGLGCRGEPH